MRTKRISKNELVKPNLIPILDAVFIFIFFLLMSAKFINLRQIGSDLPVVSESEPPKDKEPLALAMDIYPNKLVLKKGLAEQRVFTLKKQNGKFDYKQLSKKLTEIKRKNKAEKDIILTPKNGVEYVQIVSIMDHVRTLDKGEVPIFIKKNGRVEESRKLFSNIVFSNISD